MIDLANELAINHLISNKREWNNFFLKTPQDIAQIFSTLFCEKKLDVTMYR